MSPVIQWNNTVSAIEDLLRSLQCSLCNCTLTKPTTVGRCYHLFCNTCILQFSKGRKDTTCPTCEEPFWDRDIKVDHQIEQIIALCQEKLPKLRASLMPDPSDSQAQPPSPSDVPQSPSLSSTAQVEPLTTTNNLPCSNLFADASHSIDSFVTATNASPHECNDIDSSSRTIDLSTPPLPSKSCLAIFTDDEDGERSSNEGIETVTDNDVIDAKKDNIDKDVPSCDFHLERDDESNEGDKVENCTSRHIDKGVERVVNPIETSLPIIQPPLPPTPVEPSPKSQHVKRVSTTYKKKTRSKVKLDLSGDGVYGKMSDVSLAAGIDLNERDRDKENIQVELLSPPSKGTERRRSKRKSKESAGSSTPITRKKKVRTKNLEGENEAPLFASPLPTRTAHSLTTPIKQSSPMSTPRSTTPHSTTPRNKRNHKGETPLHRAVIAGNVARAQELVGCPDVDVNAPDNAGWSPLHDACARLQLECVRVLLDAGADPNSVAANRDTPLHDAVAKGNALLIQMLLDAGAVPGSKNEAGLLPRDYTTNEEIIGLLDSAASRKVLTPNPVSIVTAESPETPVILCSGTALQNLPKNPAMVFEVVQDFSDKVTHLVCGVDRGGYCKRTIKFFRAMARFLPVVRESWLRDSLRKGSWLPLSPSHYVTAAAGYIPHAPQKSHRNCGSPGLFTGLNFFLDRRLKVGVGREVLEELITRSQGVLLGREPRAPAEEGVPTRRVYHAPQDSVFNVRNVLIISEKSELESPRGLPVRDVSWVLDCITNFEIGS